MLNIFSPVVEEDLYHPNFRLMMRPAEAEARNVISGWTDGFVDRDNKIIHEFQTTFNSSFWEFYLNAAFKKLGFNVDFSKDRPDYILSKDGCEIVAEATIASNPDGGTPEWVGKDIRNIKDDTLFQVLNLSRLRLSNAIYSKYKTYLNNYSQLNHVSGKPFIICVSPFDQPFFFLQSDVAIRQVLYKYTQKLYIKDERSDEVRIIGSDRIERAIKPSGTEIDLGFFTDDRMKEVSAVVFSNTATATKVKGLCSDKYPNTMFYATRYNKFSWDAPHIVTACGGDYKESLLDGLHVFNNPFAETPLDMDLFYDEDIVIHDYDCDSGESFVFCSDGALLSHGCLNIFPKDMHIDVHKDNDQVYKDTSFNIESGVLYELSANVGTGVNNHIAHYLGWTVIIFMDKIDGDWYAFAKNKIVYTMQSFINLGEDYNMIDPGGVFFDNKEEAFEAIKDKISRNVKDVSLALKPRPAAKKTKKRPGKKFGKMKKVKKRNKGKG